MFGVGPTPGRAPTRRGGERNGCRNKRRGLGAFALGSVFVEVGDAARGVDDEDAARSRLFHDVVERSCHFGNATGSGFAPMVVPHVADNESGFVWIPFNLVLGGRTLTCGVICSRPHFQTKLLIGGEVIHQGDGSDEEE